MKIGIDSYCYHRYFGEVYEGVENPPKYEMTLEDFIKRATELLKYRSSTQQEPGLTGKYI